MQDGVEREVSVTFEINGVRCTKTGSFKLMYPVVTFTSLDRTNYDPPKIGTVSPYPQEDPTEISLGNATADIPNGIIFAAEVTLPPECGFKPAKWAFGQLISFALTAKDEATGKCTSVTSNFEWVFDGPWPYDENADPPGPPWDTGTGMASVDDSPGISKLQGRTQVTAQNDFLMYLMFLPAVECPGAGTSAWVPLCRVEWYVYWCAEKKNGKWSVVTSRQGASSWVVDNLHPEWDTKLDEDDTWPVIDVTCPGPCSGGGSSSGASSSSGS
jgi:hypothetical protein